MVDVSKANAAGPREDVASALVQVPISRFYGVAVGVFLLAAWLTSYDRSVSDWLHFSSLKADAFLRTVTYLGDGSILIPAGFVLYLLLRFIRPAVASLALLWASATVAAGLAVQGLKAVFGRARPYLAWDANYTNVDFSAFHWLRNDSNFSSFPSGHSSLVFVGVWMAFCIRPLRPYRWIGLFVGLVVAGSRIALGKHFLADVLGGSMVALLVTMLTVHFYIWQKGRKKRSPQCA